MWKNLHDRAGLVLKSTFLVEGLNLDFFINAVKKRGVTLYDVKKIANKRLILSVNFLERRKFFAIAKEMCYNIKKVGEKGKARHLLSAYRSLGVVVGCMVIALVAIFTSNYILSFSFTGSGSLYERQAKDYLYSNGVKPFTRFSDFDLNTLENGLLSNLSGVSFVSVKRSGNRLVVEMALSNEKPKTLDGNVFAMYAQVDGVVESIKVYRGTQVVSVGDFVKSGDLLVDGVAVINEQSVKINVIACVAINCQKEYSFISSDAGLEEQVIALAKEKLGDKNIVSTSVQVENLGGQFVYKASLTYKQVFYVG